jgi:ribosome-binding protein aMBF1 (putative translation factor)
MKVDGTNLAAARERVFMSQEELAEALSLNPVVVIRLEAAERTEVRENLGQDLAQILFVGRSELSSYPDPPKPVPEPEDLPDIGEQKP